MEMEDKRIQILSQVGTVRMSVSCEGGCGANMSPSPWLGSFVALGGSIHAHTHTHTSR